ncbi:MAG: hypothetical protein D6756_00950, partial [Cyanobacteria bacterium J083]
MGQVYKKFGILGGTRGKESQLRHYLQQQWSLWQKTASNQLLDSINQEKNPREEKNPSLIPQVNNNYDLAKPLPELPEGEIDLHSPFYIERPPIESLCRATILQPGALIRIKAPRQMGKTSLMSRILHSAQAANYRTVYLTFQLAEQSVFSSLDRFLKWFCANIGHSLGIANKLPEYWDDFLGSSMNCKAYFEQYLLPEISQPLVLGLDEVDKIFEYPEIAADFLGLLRAWHEESKRTEVWRGLRLIVVHSTEVYIPMDINQSPFNVGLAIDLPEFNEEQVAELSKRYGLNWNKEEIKTLMDLVGGHPYLIRVAMYEAARGEQKLERIIKEANTEAGIYGDHLRRHLWILSKYPELMAGMKQLVNSNSALRLDSTIGFKLESMG